MGNTHFLHALAQHFGHACDQVSKSLRLLVACFFFTRVFQFAQIESAPCNGLQRLAFIFIERTKPEFIDAFGQQQHFDALLAEYL